MDKKKTIAWFPYCFFFLPLTNFLFANIALFYNLCDIIVLLQVENW